MFKKIIMGLGITGLSLFAVNLNIPLKLDNNKWNITFNQNGTYYLMLPFDISFSDIQKMMDKNDTVYVYRWYQRSDLVKADFGENAPFGLVKITKNSIIYAIKDSSGNWIKNYDFDTFKTKMDELADNITDEDKRKIFKNSYVLGFEKIKANKLYLIKSKNSNFVLNIKLPSVDEITNNSESDFSDEDENASSNNENTNSTSETTAETNSSLEALFPPQVPSLQ